ncbi:putative exopolysaccharide biosynthesis protein [Leptolyngbya sp. NIES-3755]|nr:putative exopolysaccharide biosynthesis protein [Leptolyngbya sp. NIES-3755]
MKQPQNPSQTPASDAIELDLRKTFMMLTRYWLPATLAFSLVTVPAAVFLMTRKSSYQATGAVLVKKQASTTSVLGLQVDVGEIESLDKSGPLTTQAELIKSLPIVQRTIEDLNLQDDDNAPLKVEDFLKRLKVTPVNRSDILRVEYRSNDPMEAAEVVNHLMQLYVQDNLTANRAEAKSAREFIQSQLPEVERNVRQVEGEIRAFKENNQIVALDQEQRNSVEITSDFNKRIEDTRAKLVGAIQKVNALKNQVGTSNEIGVAQVALSQSTGVQETLKRSQELQNQLAVTLGRYRAGHPKVTELQRQVSELQELLQQRVATVVGQTTAPRATEDDLQMGQFRQQLVTELVMAEIEQMSLEGQVESLSGALSAQQQRASTLPRLSTRQAELERRLRASQSTYESLLSKLQEIQVAEQQQLGNARITSKALIPEKPTLLTSALGRSLLLAGSGGAGLLLAFAATVLAYLLDRRIRTVQDLKDVFDYPVLGMIPSFTDSGLSQVMESLTKNLQKLGNLNVVDTELVVRDAPRSAPAAAYQMLQSNLKYVSSDREARAIVVSSCIPSEGKSTVSANLASAFAQIGKRVLLIDADLRRPRQHHVWSLGTNDVGFSDVLVGVSTLEDALCPVMENLWLLPAGKIPPNPIALLDSERMSFLMQVFLERYDYVIFDTPPLSGIADATILGKRADGLVLVSRLGVINFDTAKNAKEYIRQAEQKVLGIVVNDVNPKDEPDSYFYGSYYYYGSENSGAIQNGRTPVGSNRQR